MSATHASIRSQPALPAGAAAKLGKYELRDEIGRGAMGVVYRAYDTVLQRDVALKVMNAFMTPMADMHAQFRLEARAVAKLAHPNIVTIHELVIDEEAPYIVMELLVGENLEERLKRASPTVLESLDIVKSVCLGLDHAHEQKLVHRDVKPANVFLPREGELKIMDFGMVRAAESSETSDLMGGTADYMSPEQAQGRVVDHRSDIFGVGVVLYRLLTGEKPFRGGRTEATLLQVIQHEVESVPFADGRSRPELEKIVVRALAKDVERRYQSARELAEDIEDWRSLHAEEEEPPRAGSGVEAPPMPPEEALRYLKQHTRTEADFPVVRQTAVNLMRLPEGGDSAQVVEVVIQDPGLTSKILKVANSAFFNRSQNSVDSLHRAVGLLGLDLIRNACLGLGFSDAATPADPRVELGQLSSRAFFAASLGKELGESCGHPNPQEVFTGALLHNLPRMAMALHLPDVYLYIERLVERSRFARGDAERMALGVPIYKLGLSIGSHWELSENLIEAMGSSESATLEKARTPLAATRASAYLANAIADQILTRSGSELALQSLLRKLERTLDIGEGAAVSIIELAHARAVEFAQAFGIDLQGFEPPGRSEETIVFGSKEIRSGLIDSLSGAVSNPS